MFPAVTHQLLWISDKAFQHFHTGSCHSCRGRRDGPRRGQLRNPPALGAAPWSGWPWCAFPLLPARARFTQVSHTPLTTPEKQGKVSLKKLNYGAAQTVTFCNKQKATKPNINQAPQILKYQQILCRYRLCHPLRISSISMDSFCTKLLGWMMKHKFSRHSTTN